MTDTQHKALLLADALDALSFFTTTPKAAAEFRRLHSLNQELLNALKLLRTEAGEGDLAAWFIKEVTDDLIAKAEEQA